MSKSLVLVKNSLTHYLGLVSNLLYIFLNTYKSQINYIQTQNNRRCSITQTFLSILLLFGLRWIPSKSFLCIMSSRQLHLTHLWTRCQISCRDKLLNLHARTLLNLTSQTLNLSKMYGLAFLYRNEGETNVFCVCKYLVYEVMCHANI